MESNIERFNIETKQGNILNFIFNTETNLLIINLIEKSGAAENQFIWRYIDENSLLEEALEIAQ
ncbi:MAG: hypothetical protein PHF18_14755 [Methanosarcina sp.]|uniref:hypothetical protein n=1 Tax=Methanosarcina sp. TaxID=2213 RepID=UPI0026111173|nr:hypothetical protein [Methanosarcina sp.]MDD3248089.1 hypothetical protein [Methanosarcina sp.]MDD4248953.1 hypothetical protein [Methanosarcina sp.]